MNSEVGTERACWVGVDLGGTKMRAVAYDGKFTPKGRRRKRTKGHEGAEAGVARLIGTIESALEDAGVAPQQLAGIGVGCPSPIDMRGGRILHAVNLGWIDVPLQAELEQAFDCPVAVLNDVDAGLYGEHRFGAAVGAQGVLGIFPGTGIGGGYVRHGEIHTGVQRSCMEIGHIQVDPGGPRCGCGRRGCLESVASRLAISAEIAKAAYRGEAPHVMKNVGADITKIRSAAIEAAIAQGDTVVESIVRRAARWIGIAVANFVHLMGPDRIVLGGGLVESMPDLFVNEVQQAADERVMTPYQGTFKVEAAQLGDNASVQGAAAWVQYQVSRTS